MAAGITKRFLSLEDIANLVPEPFAKKEGHTKRVHKINAILRRREKDPCNGVSFFFLGTKMGKKSLI